ncbi:MAG: calcium/proton exchanger [Gemmatimonadaceae bacterium]
MIFNWMLLVVPASLVLAYLVHAPPLVVFGAAVLGIVPLAEWIRRATEQMANVLGPAIGGLLNVTFGNMAELLLAVFMLLQGNTAVVKGQITGSIIGNGLLGLGLAIVVGSWGRERQKFNRAKAGQLSSLLILSVIALMVPALFNYTERDIVRSASAGRLDEKLSLGVSVVLILVYVANLVYTLITHRDVFRSAHTDEDGSSSQAETNGHAVRRSDAARKAAVAPDPGAAAAWPMWKSLGVLLVGTALTAWESEIVSGALTPAAGALGLSTFFMGVIVLAVIGNAAEYAAAIYFARKDRMTLVMGVTVGSSVQVALLVAPVLVLLSYFLGRPMNLVFTNPLELIAIASVAFSVNAIAQDGETTWFEGVLLLAVYALFVLAFLFVTP